MSTRTLTLFGVILAAALALGACQSAQESLATSTALKPLDETLAALRSESLGRGRVNWDDVERSLKAKAGREPDTEKVDALIAEAVAALHDPHARYVPARREVAAVPSVPASESASTQAAAAPVRPPIPTVPEGRMLEGRVGYVLVPMRADGPREELAEYARAARRVLAELEAQSPAGWVIDLRLNGGGTMWPMLAGLWPLLGDGPQFTSVGEGGTTATFGLTRGEAWLDDVRHGRSVFFTVDDAAARPLTPRPVAVLIGPWTISSGESMAIALRSLPDARSFGEPSAGLTTVTQTYTLSDGSQLFLPVSRMGDRAGRAVEGALVPDERVGFDAWPSAEDAVTAAACRWIAGRR